MTQLYLDTEFNGHGGQLLSIALANPTKTGKHFYARLPDPPRWHPWVLEHVAPHFHQAPEEDGIMRFRLRHYLAARPGATIYADWPADFMYLMQALMGPTFDQAYVPDIKMVLLQKTDPKPEIPHNALSDAIALMEWHQGVTAW